MTSNNSSSFNSGPETVQGSGNWAPGTTVREIEGHFHKDNEPQGVAPISQTGGVPKVDYNPSTGEKIKDTLSGHSGATSSSSHGTHGTGSGLTGSHHSSSNTSGLTGSHNNNNHDNRSATEKMKDAVTPGSSTSHNTSGTGHSGSSAYNTGSTTGTGAGAGLAGQHNNRDTQAGLTGSHGLGGNSSSSHHDSRSTGDKVRDTVGGHPGYGESPSDVNRTTGSSTTGSGLSGSHPTSSHGGATHGISDNAQRDLNSTGDSSRKTGLGATGDHSQQGHGMGTTTATGTAAPNSRAGDAANKLEGSLTGRDNVSGSNTEAKAADKLTGAGGAHDSAPESKFGSGGHHGSSDSPAGVHNSTTQPQKEGVFDKIKHAIGK